MTNLSALSEKQPKLVIFDSIGSSQLGFITVAEAPRNLPFDIKRTYWTYYTPHNVVRGNHAHKALEQILVAVNGIIHVGLEDANAVKTEYVLDTPNKGLYIPRMHWRTLRFSHNAVLLCLASMIYEEEDYIRGYEDFKRISLDGQAK